MARREGRQGEAITIKKYANRRLYNTASSSYITLDDLARMTREGVDFKVIDAKTGDDITHSILTQIIMDEEARGAEQMLPVSFLRQLIALYGDSMQAVMPHYLEAMMDNFRRNQTKLQDAFQQGVGANPLARMAETNMAMMRAATEAFMPKKPDAPSNEPADDIARLREQMAAMQAQLDALDK